MNLIALRMGDEPAIREARGSAFRRDNAYHRGRQRGAQHPRPRLPGMVLPTGSGPRLPAHNLDFSREVWIDAPYESVFSMPSVLQ